VKSERVKSRAGQTFFSKECKVLTFFSKERNVLYVLLCSFEKNVTFFTFFYILCKRMLHSLRSFTFFEKERNILCILLRSLEKNEKERNIKAKE